MELRLPGVPPALVILGVRDSCKRAGFCRKSRSFSFSGFTYMFRAVVSSQRRRECLVHVFFPDTSQRNKLCNTLLAVLVCNSLPFPSYRVDGGDGPGLSVGSAQTHCTTWAAQRHDCRRLGVELEKVSVFKSMYT